MDRAFTPMSGLAARVAYRTRQPCLSADGSVWYVSQHSTIPGSMGPIIYKYRGRRVAWSALDWLWEFGALLMPEDLD